MEDHFKQLVTELNRSSLSIDQFQTIIDLLKQHTDEFLPSFIAQSFPSLLELQLWAWQILTEDYNSWINPENYLQLLDAIATFNKNLIFNNDDICTDTKAKLLFCFNIDQANQIFQQIERSSNDNHPYINMINIWFDNFSHFIQDNPNFTLPSVVCPLVQYFADNIIKTQQFKLYLNQLRQKDLSQSIFTAKFLFYIKTSLFCVFSYMGTQPSVFPPSINETFSWLGNESLEIIHIHNSNLSSWSKELPGCIAQLISAIAGYLWLNKHNPLAFKNLFPTQEMLCGYLEELTRIIAYEPFYTQIRPVRSNDQTILVDVIILFMTLTVRMPDIILFIRSNLQIQRALLKVAETSPFDEICLCSYSILGSVLTDDQLSQLKIADTMAFFFFNMLEKAWNHSSKKYKHVALPHLVKSFQLLSKNDSVQQKTADLNKMRLLIDISSQYSEVYHVLWGLSFNKDIQEQLRSNTSFMSTLSHKANDCEDAQMRKALYGILWNLESNHNDPLSLTMNKEKAYDIMISYSHKDKELCKQIYDELIKSNYRVWIDFDQMHGNVMDAMAQAIESSQTVIICMSEDYRKSNYCRAEAQYAFQRQRKIVPVLLQKHYKPDGWLLFLIGQILYIDFNKHEFNRAMQILYKELTSEDVIESYISPIEPKEDAHPTTRIPSCTSAESILEWTAIKVHEWLVQNKLHQMSRLLSECDGRSLVYLSIYLKKGQTNQMLNLIQADAVQRINENISLIELCRFQSLMDEQKRFLQSKDSWTNNNTQRKS